MISVLIPIYNFDVTNLVNELAFQCDRLSAPIEILCFDDGSNAPIKQKNRALAELDAVWYMELEKNIGRSAIRNFLASKAKFDYLLFLDSDSEIISPSFLADYLNVLPTDKVWMGGRVYAPIPPKKTELFLHWYYGHKRESMTAEIRNKQPYHHFMTNNFLLPKKVFFEVPLDESVKGYGHEDTLWGFALKKHNTGIGHLDNPILHLGLERNDVFLSKSTEAINNLAMMFQEKREIETRLISFYLLMKKLRLLWLFSKMVCPFRGLFKRKLFSKNPNLLYFDLLKFCHFYAIIKNRS